MGTQTHNFWPHVYHFLPPHHTVACDYMQSFYNVTSVGIECGPMDPRPLLPLCLLILPGTQDIRWIIDIQLFLSWQIALWHIHRGNWSLHVKYQWISGFTHPSFNARRDGGQEMKMPAKNRGTGVLAMDLVTVAHLFVPHHRCGLTPHQSSPPLQIGSLMLLWGISCRRAAVVLGGSAQCHRRDTLRVALATPPPRRACEMLPMSDGASPILLVFLFGTLHTIIFFHWF